MVTCHFQTQMCGDIGRGSFQSSPANLAPLQSGSFEVEVLEVNST